MATRAARGLDRRAILDAAIALTQREGLWALGVRRLARELGVWPTAVQYHIDSKRQLVELIVERAAGEVRRPPTSGPWEPRLRAYAHAVRRTLLDYPGVAEFLLTNGAAGPNGIRLGDACVRTLLDARLPDRDVAHAYLELHMLVIGTVHREQARGVDGAVGGGRVAVNAANERALSGLALDAAPHLAAVLPVVASLDDEQRFAWQLDLFVDGLRARLVDRRAPRRGASRSPPRTRPPT